MSERARCVLYGVLRLSKSSSGLTLPVFQHQFDNNYYMAEADDKFRIVQFLKFYNEESFVIEPLYGAAIKRHYSIGDQVPVAFRMQEDNLVIDSSFDTEKIIDEIKSHRRVDVDSSILDEVKGVFKKLWSGDFGKYSRDQDREYRKRVFDDIYYENPVKSAYWIRRFNMASLHAEEYFESGEELRKELRNVFSDWIVKFLTKADPSQIHLLVEHAVPRLIGDTEREAIYSYVATRKILDGAYSFLNHSVFQEAFLDALPLGVCGAYIDHGSAHNLYNFRARQSSEDIVPHVNQRIRERIIAKDFKNGLLLATYAYGNRALPKELEMDASNVYHEEARALNKRITDAFAEHFRDRGLRHLWSDLAEDILKSAERLNFGYRLFSEDNRLKDSEKYAPIVRPEVYSEITRYLHSKRK